MALMLLYFGRIDLSVFVCGLKRVNKTNFHMKGFAPGLSLKKRRKATRKSPIQRHTRIPQGMLFSFASSPAAMWWRWNLPNSLRFTVIWLGMRRKFPWHFIDWHKVFRIYSACSPFEFGENSEQLNPQLKIITKNSQPLISVCAVRVALPLTFLHALKCTAPWGLEQPTRPCLPHWTRGWPGPEFCGLSSMRMRQGSWVNQRLRWVCFDLFFLPADGRACRLQRDCCVPIGLRKTTDTLST